MAKPLQLVALSIFTIVLTMNTSYAEVPIITGSPTIDKPKLLEWPLDIDATDPNLSEPTANNINDLHARISKCDDINVVLSTAGNYHMALRDLWYDHFLPNNTEIIRNWFYTTSPPISPEQIQNLTLTFGNVRLECRPIIAVGPTGLMTTLTDLKLIEGDPIPVIKNHGNVILVKKGNPKNIKTIWDLGRKNVKVVTSNPYTEKGSFSNYRDSIYNIALNDPNKPANWTAEGLFNAIFNSTEKFNKHSLGHSSKQGAINQVKWLSGQRIHHREVPWSIAYGQADAGLIFYHLALYMVRTFPDKFDIVPLGGTVENPEPVSGNKEATLFVAKIKGELNNDQYLSREELINAYTSAEFDLILARHGLLRP
ncbi:MAG: substrate-binding domain-containing protein [Gammaproteobacteria bacterium]|nr:substrate-binding domain-containing protein [Gammaproteobacteria bacterium]MCW8987457.1 substrate-binding domain-containing protein [Gammaproteobacteria bacterium]MCW9031567.1 substrate-binding domain-containing protein [Gammaproteobacteria bacterium]